jgi:16S rRNA (adenine1518-N6/adenine1519-N6)-dimethyltransferase
MPQHHVARKRFGQHFLVDEGVIAAIVREIAPKSGQPMVEVGPGLGALTRPLLEEQAKLTLIELDRDLAARWRMDQRVVVIEADVLTVNFRDLAAASGKALRVVGNLPYNISSPILFHLLDVADVVEDQHFMLQKEVVERIVAKPGQHAYGRLSVMLQWRYHCEMLMTVRPEAFEPPPRVESAIIRMIPLPDATVVDAKLLSSLVAAAFSQRRKLLRHSLGKWLEAYPEAPAFDLKRRAEEVPVREFVQLAHTLSTTPSIGQAPQSRVI